MGRLYIFMGKSATGKDTLYMETMKRFTHIKPVVTYTTRPIRTGETDGRHYHFVSDDTFGHLLETGKVIEYRKYDTVKGSWYYFTADDGQIDLAGCDYAMIMTLEGYMALRDHFGEDAICPIYIEVDDIIRIERSLHREKKEPIPCVAEVCRRYLADEEDFSGERIKRAQITHRIENNTDIESALRQIAQIIREQG